MLKPYTVELRNEDGWGDFDSPCFEAAYEARRHAELCLAEEGWTAARVWKAGPSLIGDTVVWDSRD